MRQQDIAAIYALTPLQEEMVRRIRRSGHADLYVQQCIFTFAGALDSVAASRAWQMLLDAHAILRTVFVEQSSEHGGTRWYQVVVKEATIICTFLDWRDSSVIERGRRMAALLQNERESGMSLTDVPLSRLFFVSVSPTRQYLMWTHPHVLLDGWSLSTLLGEWLRTYHALQSEQSEQSDWTLSSAIRRSFQDYVAWMNQQRSSAAQPFWLDYFSGYQRSASTGDSPERLRAYRAGQRTFVLSAQQSGALQQYARHLRITLNTVMQGIWALTLACLRSQRDIIFGTFVSGRSADMVGIEDIIGLCINCLPVRIEVAPETLIDTWLKHLFARQLDAQTFEHTPLRAIKSWLGVPADEELFDSLYVFENYPVAATLTDPGTPPDAGLRFVSDHIRERMGYPLHIVILPGNRLTIHLNYDQALFAPAEIQRVIDTIRRLVVSLVECSGATLGAVAPELPQ